MHAQSKEQFFFPTEGAVPLASGSGKPDRFNREPKKTG
jgi:hypothetical protein